MAYAYKAKNGIWYRGNVPGDIYTKMDGDLECLNNAIDGLEDQIQSLQDKIDQARNLTFNLREMVEREPYVEDEKIKSILSFVINHLSGVETEELNA